MSKRILRKYMVAGEQPGQPLVRSQRQGVIGARSQAMQPQSQSAQKSMPTKGQSPTGAAQPLKPVPSAVLGAQQKPALHVAGVPATGRPSPEAQKSPKEAQKSPAGQLVRNRVEFNPLA